MFFCFRGSQLCLVIKSTRAYCFLWKPKVASSEATVLLKSPSNPKTLVLYPEFKLIEAPFLEYPLEVISTLPEVWSA